MAQLPAWTNGVVLQYKGTAQTILNNLKTEGFAVGGLEIGGVGEAKVEFSYTNDPAVNSITFGPDLTFPNCNINSSVNIGTGVQRRDLEVTNKITTSNILVNAIDLGVGLVFGNKINPVKPEAGRNDILMLGSQNKLIFKYDGEFLDNTLIVSNPLVKTCMVFLKDLTGVRDIPGATIEFRPEIDSVIISNIPADVDGFAKGMLLFL